MSTATFPANLATIGYVSTSDDDAWRRICAAARATSSLPRTVDRVLHDLDNNLAVRINDHAEGISVNVFRLYGDSPAELFTLVLTRGCPIEAYDIQPRPFTPISLVTAAKRAGGTGGWSWS